MQKEKIPTISVVMPVYNAENYLMKSIESIIKQTFLDFEFIIVNDCSTDSTANILASLNDKRIIIINNNVNRGVTHSTNIGCKSARGKYIARMDADDIAILDRLELQVKYLDENPSVVLVGGYSELIDENDKPFGRTVKVPLSYNDIIQKIFTFNTFINPSVMFRTSVFLEMNGYNSEYLCAEDYDFFLRIIQENSVANLPKVLIQYRVHPQQLSQSKIKLQRTTADKVRFLALQEFFNNKCRPRLKAPPVRNTYLDCLFGKEPSLGSDYLSWIYTYQNMGRKDLARQLIIPAILSAPLFGHLYRELFRLITQSRHIDRLRWYKKRAWRLVRPSKS